MITPKELKIIRSLVGIKTEKRQVFYKGCFGSLYQYCDKSFCEYYPLCKIISTQLPKFKDYVDFLNWRDEE